MSSVTGFDSAANSGSGVPCASKPDGTVVVDVSRAFLHYASFFIGKAPSTIRKGGH